MKKVSIQFLLTLSLLTTGISCSSSAQEEVLESGVRYQIFPAGESEVKADSGKIITFELILSVAPNDSVVQNTYEIGQPAITMVKGPTYSGDPMEVFPFLAAGDSVIIHSPADSLRAYLTKMGGQLPSSIPEGSEMKYVVKVLKVQTQEEFEQAQNAEANKQKDVDKELIEKYIKDNKLEARALESGLYYIQTQEGEGETPETGVKVKVHYTGKLLDGKVFDSSVERNTPFEFSLGTGQVIKGWDEGIAIMKKGEKGTLLIPSHLGYGQRGAGADIPPNSVLLFEVELLDF